MKALRRFLTALVVLLLLPGLLVAATAQGGTGSDLLAGVVAIVIPFATTYAMSGLKSVVAAIGTLPALPQQIVVFAIGFGIVHLAAVSGLPLPGDLSGWGPETVLAFLNWLVTMGLHKVLGKK